jgi:hypothetical protein
VADVVIIKPTQERRCINCKLMHPRYTPCSARCTLCVGIPAHQFRDKKLCNNYLNWIKKKKADGTHIEYPKRGCNTTIIASFDHSDDTILYRDYKESIATANGQLTPL